VFEDERRRVAAWYTAYTESDGNAEVAQEAERNEIIVLRKERDEADERNRLAFEKMVRQGEEIKRQREIETAKNGYPSILGATGSNGVFSPYSNEEVVHVAENPELKDLREKRLQDILSKEDKVTETEVKDPQSPNENTPVPNGAITAAERVGEGESMEEPVKWTKFQITEEDSEGEKEGEAVGDLGVDVDEIDLTLKLDGEGEVFGEEGVGEKATTDLYELD
jgi:hypothetical protein